MSRVHLRLPATSANLGPGFDALALALQLYLEIEAEEAESFRIEASGRNPAICAATENNLLLLTYEGVLRAEDRPVPPLRIRMENGIPLGMGCGSSAAVRLAATALAAHFGSLGWSRERILSEACRLEGHPDNAAACWEGGFVASALDGEQVQAVSFAPPEAWRAVIVMPEHPLATTASRGVLPGSHAMADVIANVQRTSLLTAAFATGRAELLANAMRDRLHQPWRAEVCPLLPKLLPLAGRGAVAGVALSGAGPAVLLLCVSAEAAEQSVREAGEALKECAEFEFLVCGLERSPAIFEILV